MSAARLHRSDAARAHVVDCVVRPPIAIIVLLRRAVSGGGKHGALALPERAVRARLRPALTDPDVSVRTARSSLSVDASTTLVREAIAVCIVAVRTRVLKLRSHRTTARTKRARRLVSARHTGL